MERGESQAGRVGKGRYGHPLLVLMCTSLGTTEVGLRASRPHTLSFRALVHPRASLSCTPHPHCTACMCVTPTCPACLALAPGLQMDLTASTHGRWHVDGEHSMKDARLQDPQDVTVMLCLRPRSARTCTSRAPSPLMRSTLSTLITGMPTMPAARASMHTLALLLAR